MSHISSFPLPPPPEKSSFKSSPVNLPLSPGNWLDPIIQWKRCMKRVFSDSVYSRDFPEFISIYPTEKPFRRKILFFFCGGPGPAESVRGGCSPDRKTVSVHPLLSPPPAPRGPDRECVRGKRDPHVSHRSARPVIIAVLPVNLRNFSGRKTPKRNNSFPTEILFFFFTPVAYPFPRLSSRSLPPPPSLSRKKISASGISLEEVQSLLDVGFRYGFLFCCQLVSLCKLLAVKLSGEIMK